MRGAGRGWMPYVAPCHGGVDARVLSVLRDPGPKTAEQGGSGFLCIDNDDPTAARQVEAFAAVGIDVADSVVLLQGRDAQDGWRRLTPRDPRTDMDPSVAVVRTYHPGRQAMWSADATVRRARQAHRDDALCRGAQALG